eukprot:6800851-Pyramimonas_sp.AAC.1
MAAAGPLHALASLVDGARYKSTSSPGLQSRVYPETVALVPEARLIREMAEACAIRWQATFRCRWELRAPLVMPSGGASMSGSSRACRPNLTPYCVAPPYEISEMLAKRDLWY